jgi:hypothetical protein
MTEDHIARFAEALRTEARVADEKAASGSGDTATRNAGAAKRLREIADDPSLAMGPAELAALAERDDAALRALATTMRLLHGREGLGDLKRQP